MRALNHRIVIRCVNEPEEDIHCGTEWLLRAGIQMGQANRELVMGDEIAESNC